MIEWAIFAHCVQRLQNAKIYTKKNKNKTLYSVQYTSKNEKLLQPKRGTNKKNVTKLILLLTVTFRKTNV